MASLITASQYGMLQAALYDSSGPNCLMTCGSMANTLQHGCTECQAPWSAHVQQWLVHTCCVIAPGHVS